MSDWLLNLPVLWMAVVVFAATYLLAASIYWNRITLPERSILQRISRLVVPTVIALHHYVMEAFFLPGRGGLATMLVSRPSTLVHSDAPSIVVVEPRR